MQKFVDLTGGDSTASTPLTERTLVGLPPLAERAAPAAEVDLDLTGHDEDYESKVDEDGLFDLTATMEDDLIDLTATASPSEQSVELIDLTTADKSSQAETLFDVSGPADAVDAMQFGDDLLDITGGDRAEEEFPAVDLADTSELLDVTRSGDLTGTEDLDPLNVTSPGEAASRAETLLDLTRGHLDDTHEGMRQSAAHPDTLSFAASDASSAILADTSASPAVAPDLSLDFDISSPGAGETGADTGFGDGFDLALETTGDLEALSTASDKTEESDLAFDLDLIVDDSPEAETVARVPADALPSTALSIGETREVHRGDQDFENMLDDAKRSMQTLQLGDDDIEFDLSLEDTGELSALRDSEIEMPGGNDDSLGQNVDETLADLATSMEDTVAGLEESDDDLERSLDLGARIESDVFQSTVSQSEATKIAEGASLANDADEIDTKLNLSKAYVELGDVEGARAILDEVVADGDESQRAAARSLLGQIDAK
jgi:pilus assembly protein FimV